MAAEMTTDEWQAFLRHGTRTGKLAVIRSDGRPLVMPVWFVLDDDGVIRFQSDEHSAKAKCIAREPRVCLTVDDQEPPYSFVIVEGHAAAAAVTDEERHRVALACGNRYMGADRGEEFARRNAVPGEATFELRIDRVIAARDVSA